MKLFLSFFVIVPTILFAQQIDDNVLDEMNMSDTIPFNPNVKKNKLPNGFTYYLARNTSQPGKILIRLNVKAGILQQEKEQTEAAHVVEHIVMRSSTHFPPDSSLKEYLKAASISYYNAHPDNEFTTYYFETKPDTIVVDRICLAFQDWLSGKATLTNEAISAEKQVVVAEIAERGVPDYFNAACKVLEPSRFSDTYRVAASADFKDKVATVSPAAIQRFYKNWYRPELGALMVVGDIDTESLERIIKRRFERLSNPVYSPVYPTYRIPLIGVNKYIIDLQPAKENRVVSISMFFMMERHHQITYQAFRESVLADLFNKMLQQRLSDINKKNSRQMGERFYGGLGNGIYAIQSLPIRSLQFSIHCDSVSSVEKSFKILFREAERIKRYGFSEQALEIAKSALLADLSHQGPEGLMEESQRYTKHFIEDEACPSMTIQLQLKKKFINELTVKEINQEIQSWFTATNRHLVIQAPENVVTYLPNESTALSWLNKIQQDSLALYQIAKKEDEKKGVQIKINFDSLYPLPSTKPYTRSDIKDVNVIQLKLANGVRVIVKPAVSSSDDKIYIKGIRDVGASRYTGNQYFDARAAAQLVLAAGLGELSKEKIDAYQQSRNVRTDIDISDDATTVSGNTTNGELETLLQVIYRYFLTPGKDSSAYAVGLNKLCQEANLRRNFISRELITTTGEHLKLVNGYSLSLDELKNIDYNGCLESYSYLFSSPREFTFVITGAQDVEKVITLVAKYLGNLPERKESLPVSFSANVSREHQVTHTITINHNAKKDRAVASIYYTGYCVLSTHEKIKQLMLAKIIESICYQRIREKESGTYSIHTHVNTKRRTGHNTNDWYELGISFECKPGMSKRLIRAVQEEMEALKKNGPEQGDFINAIQNQKNMWLLSGIWDARWQSVIFDIVMNKEDFFILLKLNEFIDAIRPKDVQKIAQYYLRKEGYASYTEAPL